jgi:hypothetical protein
MLTHIRRKSRLRRQVNELHKKVGRLTLRIYRVISISSEKLSGYFEISDDCLGIQPTSFSGRSWNIPIDPSPARTASRI